MINFQGQVSPVFLAMEGNVVVPSNNQGGPVSDPNRKTTQSFKPKPVEYQHEYASSQVQNTLYDEDEADYDYSAYDGIQITEDEVIPKIISKFLDKLGSNIRRVHEYFERN